MEYRKLGKTGLSVSEIGLGTVELGREWGIEIQGEYECPDEDNANKILSLAYEEGINFIDTARGYKLSEGRIGNFLKDIGREKFYVATKSGVYTKEGKAKMEKVLLKNIETSLTELKTDYIDIMQLHSATLEVIQEGDALNILLDCKKKGMLRFIGATFYNLDAAELAVNTGLYDTIQVTYNPAMPQAERVIAMAKEKNVGVIVKSPLLKGMFSYKRNHVDTDMIGTKMVVDNFAFLEREDQSLPDASLRFSLSNDGVSTVICGTKNRKHLLSNIKVAGTKLLNEELKEIKRLQQKLDLSSVEIP